MSQIIIIIIIIIIITITIIITTITSAQSLKPRNAGLQYDDS